MLTLDAVVSIFLGKGNAPLTTVTIMHEIGSLVETEINVRNIKSTKDPALTWIQRLLKEKPKESVRSYQKIKRLIRDLDSWDHDMKVYLSLIRIAALFLISFFFLLFYLLASLSCSLAFCRFFGHRFISERSYYVFY
jgi:hypothetical protein